ncbi:MAG: hypothetical protein HN657_07330 [Candidatus Marinimicrobia bacterium]|jgi:UDP-N-acetylglucosamine diphosphorylase/glucosamine-1-phosphate N-acetyltransferase|nr:hypothetical protein [Candidatus Neomarinimicrobiota bacterium]MBT3495918.1 hypothetical protein [Candidatus Neomarinimicrobiota bacterium]MBT3692380.1 hypothetical protein [Candidatus Neomarinimicrobiota bacterium]MBT3732256.1 hypothetical protein [Candidatus Neomarinimicrobiota bacterium]MBT4144141.1 hypothetical protein [Candidatus Neomarinimicrobiota bacterium]
MIYIFEDKQALDLEPISLTRPIFEVRSGPDTFLERILKMIHDDYSLIVRDEFKKLSQEQHPEAKVNPSELEAGLWILGSAYWNKDAIELMQGKPNTIFKSNGRFVGANLSKQEAEDWVGKGGPLKEDYLGLDEIELEVPSARYLWEILSQISLSISSYLPFIQFNENQDKVYAHPSVHIPKQVVFNVEKGPIIIEENVVIKPFSYIEGPVYLGKNSIVQAHSNLSNSIIGPHCKVAGEVHGCIFQSFSNKAHDGHLGDAFIGEWVNLGAGTTNSNLKNNYTSVIMDVNGKKHNTGTLFMGALIGDHSKTAIGTQLNTGTVIGPACNVLAHSFPGKKIAPFTFYLNGKKRKMNWDDFLHTAKIVQSRRNRTMAETQILILEKIYSEL